MQPHVPSAPSTLGYASNFDFGDLFHEVENFQTATCWECRGVPRDSEWAGQGGGWAETKSNLPFF